MGSSIHEKSLNCWNERPRASVIVPRDVSLSLDRAPTWTTSFVLFGPDIFIWAISVGNHSGLTTCISALASRYVFVGVRQSIWAEPGEFLSLPAAGTAIGAICGQLRIALRRSTDGRVSADVQVACCLQTARESDTLCAPVGYAPTSIAVFDRRMRKSLPCRQVFGDNHPKAV